MKYKHFPAPFFKRLIEPRSPTIAKLNSLHGVSRGQLPHKIGPISLWFAPPPFHNFKIFQPICSFKSYKYDNYDKTKY